jgi:hypothetical protein
MMPNSLIEGTKARVKNKNPELDAYLRAEWKARGKEWISNAEEDQVHWYERRRHRKWTRSSVDGQELIAVESGER